MRKVTAIVIVAVVAMGVGYYFYARAHHRQSIHGPALTGWFLDRDFGNAAILKTPEKKVILVDPPAGDEGDALISLLRAEMVREVTIVISDPAADRARALAALQKAIKVVRVVHAEPRTAGQWQVAKLLAKCRPVAETTIGCGDVVRLSTTVRLEMLCQQAPVFRVKCGAKSILFLSTLGTEEEPELIGRGPRSSVLAISPGARWDTPSLELLSVVRPEICVISAGRRRPSTSMIRRLSPGNTGATLYRTDEDGIIEIVTDGRSMQVVAGGGP